METSQKTIQPDPSALGLFGLAMVTLVASSQKLGITTGTSLVIPWAIFLGSIAQLIAGFLDYKKMNIFGATAFLGYGLFWLAVCMTWMTQHGVFGESMKAGADINQLGFAFVGYLIFTIFMTIGALETNKVLFFIFLFIVFLFLGLSMATLGFMPEFGHHLAAYSELIISILSFYASAANVLYYHIGRTVLPIGGPFNILKK